MWLVYILKDIGIPFYVGKGAGESRAYSHEKYAKSNNLQDLGYGLTKDYNPYKIHSADFNTYNYMC
jgi:hypothetical protein